MKKLVTIFILILALTGCSDIFVTRLDISDPFSIPEGHGAVRISLVQGSARTAVPDDVLERFRFEFFFDDEARVPMNASTTDYMFILPVGEYTLRVAAFDKETDPSDAKIIAEGFATFEIVEGDNPPIPVTIRMSPVVGESEGSFGFTIENDTGFPISIHSFKLIYLFAHDDYYESVDVIMFLEERAPDEFNPEIDNGESIENAIIDDIKPGYYLLKLAVKTGDGSYAYRTTVVHIYPDNLTNVLFTFGDNDFISPLFVTNTNNDGPGSLRAAIYAATSGSGGIVEVKLPVGSVIRLEETELEIMLEASSSNITIEGNGVTITGNFEGESAGLLSIISIDSNVTIRRVYFKDGIGQYGPGAIYFESEGDGTLTLESCIFSGNTGPGGGAIRFNGADLIVKGCTFYNNHAVYGGAIDDGGYEADDLLLYGNLFYGNSALQGSPLIATEREIKGGYNVVYVEDADVTDTTNLFSAGSNNNILLNTEALPFSPKTFRVIGDKATPDERPTALPAGYPKKDFYGKDITAENFVAGAVQTSVQNTADTDYHYLDLDYAHERGSIKVSTTGGTYIESDHIFTSGTTLTLTAEPKPGYEFLRWMQNGDYVEETTNVLLLENFGNTISFQVIFSRVVRVTNFTDAHIPAVGTFRRALNNLQDYDIIRFENVTPGVTTVPLVDALPYINKNIIIEGNGVTITRSFDNGSLLDIRNFSSLLNNVTISRVHFKGKIDTYSEKGGAIFLSDTILTLESCIFSDNNANYGGAIYIEETDGTELIARGCTFYNNLAFITGGAINNQSSLSLVGNLFYGNVATAGNNNGDEKTTVFNIDRGDIYISSHNIIDVEFGTSASQSGWVGNASEGDTYVDDLSVQPEDYFVPSGTTIPTISPLPYGYPTVDFFGNAIEPGAIPGAVQQGRQ